MLYPGNIAPQKLPFCKYPSAADIESHGLQPLPAELQVIALDKVHEYRSKDFKTVSTETFDSKKILQLLRIIAKSFAINEPMARHLVPPKAPLSQIAGLRHNDPFGNDEFGEWNTANILFWVFRLFFVTNAESPLNEISINQEVKKLSLAVLNSQEEIIGGAVNVPIMMTGNEQSFRNNDPFINAVMPFFEPVYTLLGVQMNHSLKALCNLFPEFNRSLQKGKVADLNLVARSPHLPTEDTFELVAATAERLQHLGFDYLIISSANQWTGAACEVLGGVRVHFSPYRASKLINESAEPIAHIVSSKDGYISDKDSGVMLYVLRLQ